VKALRSYRNLALMDGFVYRVCSFWNAIRRNSVRVHSSNGGTGVTQEGDYASKSKTHCRVRCPGGEVATRLHFWGIITKVINCGNVRSLTTLKGSILLKEMCSRRSSRDMFDGAVGKPHRHEKCAEAPDSDESTALSNSNR